MSKMIERARKLTEDKREAVAAELLAWAKIEDTIRQAAAAGAGKAILAPTAPIKLKHTAAAAAAIERLTREQFRHQWTEHRLPQGAGPAGDQLEIEW